jgi:hypothetical protein
MSDNEYDFDDSQSRNSATQEGAESTPIVTTGKSSFQTSQQDEIEDEDLKDIFGDDDETTKDNVKKIALPEFPSPPENATLSFLKLLVRNPLSLLFSNEKFKNDLLLIMSALTNSEEPQPFPIFKASNYASATEIYGWISDEMKITPCVYHKLISFDIRALEYFPTRIMNDKELFRLYLSLDQNLQHSPSYSSTNIPSSSYLQYFSEEITGNKDFMTEIILDYPIVLCHIRKLASDMDFLKQLFIHRATKTETLTKNVAKLQLVKANGYVTSLSSELQQNQQMVEKLRQLNHCIDASIRELMRI